MEPRNYWNITDKRVLEAIRSVPRERFVPQRVRSESDGDFPLPIGYGQTISQPYIVAYMSEQLHIARHHRVLEVGTGSGYQAAVLAELAGEVYSVECIPELSRQAKEVLEQLGYTNVTIIVGNGRDGYLPAAPYDRIIVTAASEDFPKELTRQLAVGGSMMIPVGPEQGAQYLYLCTKLPSQEVTCERLLAVRFVPLVC